MFSEKLPQRLKVALTRPLPGWKAQSRMIPEGRDILDSSRDLQPAAVLIALFTTDSGWCFPLIQRSVDGFAHSGQIALPGGRKEGTESATETALREAWEEVNINPEQVTILGKLSQLPIPVSRHLVQPLIGYLSEAPNLVPDPREVDKIFNVNVRELVELNIKTEPRRFKEITLDIPYLEIQGHKVWGATAMILSEFRAILARVESEL